MLTNGGAPGFGVCLQLPLLELAFFPPEQHWELIPLDPREAVGMALNSLSTFQQGLAWDRLSGSDQDKVPLTQRLLLRPPSRRLT